MQASPLLSGREKNPKPCNPAAVSQENNEDMASFVQEDEGMSPCFSEAGG